MEIYHQQHFSLLDAAIDGQLAVAERLIAEGADLEQRSSNDTTALLNATMHGHTKLAKMLIERGANVNCIKSPEEITPLMIACSNGQDELIEVLLDADAKIAIKDNRENSCFHYACFASSLGIIKKLYDLNPQMLHEANEDGDTPLFIAAKEGRAEVIDWLIGQGAELNTRNGKGETALFWMIITLDEPSLEQLSPHFDRFDSLIHEQLAKPWIKACMLGRTHWIRQLLKWGVAVDIVDDYGNSGLHYTVAGNHVDATKLLLEEGANSDLSAQDGLTPKQLAENSKSEAIQACFS